MSARGIDAVRAHLAKIPPATTIAEKRAQYDRAERAFPVAARRGGQARAGARGRRVARAAVGARRRRDPVLPRRRLRDRLAALAPPSRRGHRPRRARRRCCSPTTAWPPSTRSPPRWTTPWPPYRWLLDRGHAPARTVLAGDSAGGGLTVATLLALRERGATTSRGRCLHLALGRPVRAAAPPTAPRRRAIPSSPAMA